MTLAAKDRALRDYADEKRMARLFAMHRGNLDA